VKLDRTKTKKIVSNSKTSDIT